MSYDSRIDDAVRRLQKQIGIKKADGAWGAASQKALLASGHVLDYDWEKLRKFNGGTITPGQFSGYVSILAAINEYGKEAINPLYAAYMLATAYHEVAGTMQPIREIGRGQGKAYGEKLNIKRERYYNLSHLYYGRGYVQLTWIDNYAKLKKVTGIDFINDPDLALVPENAARIMIEGMLAGMFTGLDLSECVRYGSYAEFVFCRRIINGTDRDTKVAGYAVSILECLNFVETEDEAA